MHYGAGSEGRLQGPISVLLLLPTALCFGSLRVKGNSREQVMGPHARPVMKMTSEKVCSGFGGGGRSAARACAMAILCN